MSPSKFARYETERGFNLFSGSVERKQIRQAAKVAKTLPNSLAKRHIELAGIKVGVILSPQVIRYLIRSAE